MLPSADATSVASADALDSDEEATLLELLEEEVTASLGAATPVPDLRGFGRTP